MTDLSETKRALLAEWEQRRNELDVLISALRRELGMAGEQAPKNGSNQVVSSGGLPANVNDLVQPGDFYGMTQVDAIKTFLQRTGKRAGTLQDIANALYRGKAVDTPLTDESKLRKLSSLLSKTPDFHSVARGRWGLSEWYPERLLQKAKKGKSSPGGSTPGSEGQDE